MTTVRQIIRSVRRLGQVSKSGAKVLNRSQRCASTLTQKKFVEGENGEKIFPSPFGDVTYPDMSIPDYVWRNIPNYGDKTALVCGITGRKYTYNQARDAANYTARAVLNLGLKAGDIVALAAPNYPETIIAYLGLLEAGLVVTTVNPYATPDEILKQLKSSGAKAVITSSGIAHTTIAVARTILPIGAPYVVIEDGTKSIPEGTISFKDLIERGKTLPLFRGTECSTDSLAVLPYSSGTTGMPKGVMLTHKNLVSNMEMLDQSTKFDGDAMWYPTTETYQEVVPLVLPFFHIYGMNAIALPRLASGTQLVTIPKFTSETFIDVLSNYQTTGLCCVPPIVLFLTTCPLIKKSHLERVHIAVSGAAPLAKSDVDCFYDKFGLDSSKLRFCQGYGLTETSPVSFFEISGKKYSSIGKNVAGCEVRIVDPVTNENISEPKKTGELWIRGPHIMKGYFRNEAATKDTIAEDGWLKTGDIVYYDEEHDFFITDRLKELIKVKGFQVPPAELEALLRTHPDVQEAAVIGIPDQRYGEVPKAFVVPKKSGKPNEEDIKDFIKAKVSEYKHLRGGVTFVDSIPTNASGKIVRSKLKQQYLK